MSGPWEDFTPPADVANMVAAEAQRQGVDPSLALRVAHRESAFSPGAVSPKGAVGVMQLMPDTAKDLGVDPTDLGQNIRGGVAYLKQQLDAFGDPKLALAAYNAGPAAVRKAGGVPNYKETQAYVAATAPDVSTAPPWMDFAPQAPSAPATSAPRAAAVTPRPAPVAPKPNGAVDFGRGLLGGLDNGIATQADQLASAFTRAPQAGFNAAWSLAQRLTGGNAPAPQLPTLEGVFGKFETKPQTVAGSYGRTIGQFAPAAAAPGSIAARVANVLVPAVASETSGQVAKNMGASPLVQQLARTAGAVVGGAASNMRIQPGAQPTEAPRNLAEVKAASDKAWAALDNSTYKVPQHQVQAAVDQMATALNDAGPELYTDAPKILARAQAMAKRNDVTVAQLNKLRTQIGNKLLSPYSTEPDMGQVFKGAIDDVILNSGDPNVAPARDLYARFKKMETVNNALGSADLLANSSAAIPQKIRPLIDPKSASRVRNFTPDEQAAARSIVKGDALTNLFLRPAATARLNGPISGPIMAGLAVPTHGATAAVGIIGSAAKAMMDARNASKAQQFLDLLSLGGKAPPSSAPKVIGFDPLSDQAIMGGLLATPPRALAATAPTR